MRYPKVATVTYSNRPVYELLDKVSASGVGLEDVSVRHTGGEAYLTVACACHVAHETHADERSSSALRGRRSLVKDGNGMSGNGTINLAHRLIGGESETSVPSRCSKRLSEAHRVAGAEHPIRRRFDQHAGKRRALVLGEGETRSTGWTFDDVGDLGPGPGGGRS